MAYVPYRMARGSVMYSMISTQPDIAFSISLLSDKDGRKSTSSYFFTLVGNCLSWKSQLQPVVTLSTTEPEYIAATEAIKETIWLQGRVRRFSLLLGAVRSWFFCCVTGSSYTATTAFGLAVHLEPAAKEKEEEEENLSSV
ncbi:hypothetical protein M9H77_09478 [Catharanthus roseus]|uniref:Uncharacterized protein n=1 Tax=Catharanthus roseus TaxID=4058 RepID=A0ACC0C160_CATRO|nr:hypothetical protein M9H77_09478 [Catharanthus roseus]